jgi:hypothetical protein
LLGLPMTVKEQFNVVGLPTSWFCFERRAGQFTEQRTLGRVEAPDATQEVTVGLFGKDVVAVGIGTVPRLSDQCRGAHAVDEPDNLANRVVPM